MKPTILRHTLLAALLIIFSQLNTLYASIDTITVQSFSFSPATLVINQGDTVVWKFISGNHSATSGTVANFVEIPDLIWDSGILSPGQTFSFTFNSLGTYPYYCIPHGIGGDGSGAMVGVISILPTGQTGQIVTISNFIFLPDTLTISKDEVVTWIIMGGMHSTTSGTSCTSDGIWNSEIMDSVGQTFSYTFTTDNTAYPYYCIPHCASNNMTGIINVGTVPVGIHDNITNRFESFQIYPNPFNNNAVIEYEISEQSDVTLKIYDLLGNEVKTLVNKSRGANLFKINASDLGYTNGVYFYRITAGDYQKSGKMILER